MKKDDFLRMLDELLERKPGTLSGSESLRDIVEWDSLALIGFIALVDKQFEMTLETREISNCKTVDELIGLLNGKVEY